MSKIICSILILLATKVTSVYWQFLFTEMAYGKVHPGLKITNTAIVIETLELSEFAFGDLSLDSDLVKLANDVIKHILQLESIRDEYEKFNSISDFISRNNSVAIQKIKFKSIKPMLIEEYIIKLSQNAMLSKRNTKKVVKFVKFGVHFKYIGNDNIIPHPDYKSIEYIDNITLNSNGIKINF